MLLKQILSVMSFCLYTVCVFRNYLLKHVKTVKRFWDDKSFSSLVLFYDLYFFISFALKLNKNFYIL